MAKNTAAIAAIQQMKREGRKIVGVVVYDYQMAQIVDRAGVDIVSVGDSVGVNMWGQESELEVTLDQMLLACRAVRRGVKRAIVSCDFPYGPMQEGADAAVRAARVLVTGGGADMLKLDAASEHPEAVRAIAAAGIPVWAQFGITPHTAARHGGTPPHGAGAVGTPGSKAGPELAAGLTAEFVEEAKLLEASGASLLDFTNSGPVAGPAVTAAVSIPVIGGLGGGPWLDGRVRAVVNAIGYTAAALDDTTERYANVARITLDAIRTYADDVRGGRQIRGK
jgi:3-methyl-2-oxobutanoate hydroxymethyltransferase